MGLWMELPNKVNLARIHTLNFAEDNLATIIKNIKEEK